MKKIFTLLCVLAAGLLSFVSCDTDYVYPDPDDIPQYMIKVPILSATATATNGYSMKGTITPLNEDNSKYSIDFQFDANGIDLTKLTISLEYCVRTIHKDRALDGPTVLDLAGKPYTMVVNDFEKDVEYTITASVIPCQEPVLSATIQCGNAKDVAEVDNVNHTVKFYISNANIDITNCDVTIVYNSRAILGNNAFESKKGMDLSKPYKFTLNDAVANLEYTLTAEYLAVPVLIPYGQTQVVRIEGDANIYYEQDGSHEKYMFDGEFPVKYGTSALTKHHQVYWIMTNAELMAAHGDWLVFDVNDVVTMAQCAMHPYKNYDAQDPLVYEIYAYKKSTTVAPEAFSATSSDWVKIIDGDDTKCWDEAQVVFKDLSLAGSDQDPVAKTQLHGTIEGITVPAARYYAFKMVKNCYEVQPTYYSKQLGWNPTNRWHCCCITELELWQYKKN